MELMQREWSSKEPAIIIEEMWENLDYISSQVNCDYNGENGEEYVSKIARENNFESDLDYDFDRLLKFYNLKEDFTFESLKKIANEIMDEMLRGAYIREYEVRIDDFQCIIACYVEWRC